MTDTPELPEHSNCPECGAEPTDESIVKQRLSDNGYLHRDTKLQCNECGERWIVGEPRGESETAVEMWGCDSCGGELMPHFVYIAAQEGVLQIRPKCRDCFHVPDTRIAIGMDGSGDSLNGLIGHPSVTGEMDTE